MICRARINALPEAGDRITRPPYRPARHGIPEPRMWWKKTGSGCRQSVFPEPSAAGHLPGQARLRQNEEP